MGKRKNRGSGNAPAANRYATDAVGGGVGPGHGLNVAGAITCADPVTGKAERMEFELPPGVMVEDLAIAFSGDVGGQ